MATAFPAIQLETYIYSAMLAHFMLFRFKKSSENIASTHLCIYNINLYIFNSFHVVKNILAYASKIFIYISI